MKGKRQLAMAIISLIEVYQKAIMDENIWNPVAWSLYQVWKMYDRERRTDAD